MLFPHVRRRVNRWTRGRSGTASLKRPVRFFRPWRVLEREQPAYVVRAAEAALRQCQRWW